MVVTQLFDELLTNLLEVDKEIKGVAVVLRDGLIVASKFRDVQTNEDLLGASTAVFDIFLKRIQKDFGSANDFITVMTVDENKFLFANAGKNTILSIVASAKTFDKKLKVYGSYVVKKVLQIINREETDTLIPRVIHLLANARSSSYPHGNYMKKAIFLGDAKVGKTSVIKYFTDNVFSESYLSTIGMNISEKVINLEDDCTLNFKFWEMESQSHEFSALRKRFYMDTAIAFIIFDLTRKDTFNNLSKWIKIIAQSSNEAIPYIIMGNKSDLPNVEVSLAEITQKEKELDSIIFLASAKTGENIEEAFNFAIHKVFDLI